MSPRLFKLKIEAETTTRVKTKPQVSLYFYELNEAHRVGDELQILATAFTDADGDPVTEITSVTPIMDIIHYL